MALRGLGADIRERDGTIEASCRKNGGLKGHGNPSVLSKRGGHGTGHTGICLADGVTIIHQAAREPEISQLCRFLNNMGAVICGMGTDHLMVQGWPGFMTAASGWRETGLVARYLRGCRCGGWRKVPLRGICPSDLKVPLEEFQKAGAAVEADEKNRQIRIRMGKRPLPLLIKTEPYPGFPTDLQSPFMAFLATAQGTSYIEEQVFEGKICNGKKSWSRWGPSYARRTREP